ncbi:DivIVA domain-containing protein [bacterium]|nr:MAG: DivIVA domain-containing protein [bacterium]
MKLTALEIKQQKFERALRGYDVGEVNAFLNVMATEWEHLVGKNRELENTIQRLQEKLQHYERVESALHETLQTAKDSATQRIENAKKESRSRVEKAEMEAENMLREARQQRHQIRQSVIRLLDRREEIIRGIRSYLEMANESLNAFNRDDSSLYQLPREDQEYSMDSKKQMKQERQPASSKIKEQISRDENPLVPGMDDVDAIIDQLD